jgi:LSD1 subclass zinc finger protein
MFAGFAGGGVGDISIPVCCWSPSQVRGICSGVRQPLQYGPGAHSYCHCVLSLSLEAVRMKMRTLTVSLGHTRHCSGHLSPVMPWNNCKGPMKWVAVLRPREGR